MKHYFFLSVFLFTQLTICKCFTLDTNKWNDFSGLLGKTEIRLSVYPFPDGTIKGNYCYKKYETKIQLTGTIKGDRIELTELLNGKTNGFFSGKIFTDNLDRLEGSWTDSSKTKTFEFKLTLSAVCGGTPEQRYEDFNGTDEDVERFMKHVKTSIISNDKTWLADHISYPLKTNVNGKRITIKNKKQLTANFDKIFTKEFKDLLQASCSCNLFNNYMGVMLGNGEIWINDQPWSIEEKFDYMITGINN